MGYGEGLESQLFFDRRDEQEQFERLLRLQDETRLLSICDSGAKGKSFLLDKLAERCKTDEPPIPVCLVKLDKVEDKSEFGLMHVVHNQLLRFFPRSSTPFPRFAELLSAMRGGHSEPGQFSMDFREAEFEGARGFKIANNQTIIKNQGNIYVDQSTLQRPELTSGQIEYLRERSVDTFLDELLEICKSRSVVLLLDTYDKCESSLQEWIVNTLLERTVFDRQNPPKQLFIVIAGKTVPVYAAEWPPKLIQARACLFPRLSQWNEDDIEQCLASLGYRYEEHHLRTFVDFAKADGTPKRLLQAMDLLLSREA